jgi:L,D-transpeptidase ErfK/SrfK
MIRRSLFVFALALPLAAFAASSRWSERDFPPRPVVALPFSPTAAGAELTTVVGTPQAYTIQKGDTLWDVARHLGLGINAVQHAFPGLDMWIPTEGITVEFPTSWVLPKSDRRGIVINIPEMRLYYFPDAGSAPPTVITYAVGLGREDWQTPTGKFHVTEKTVNPSWVIPAGIREERIRDKRRFENMIPGGDPSNPLGRYRMRLSLPLYGIHGTNIPWGVGMQVSHGCVRLYPEDIEALFPVVPLGTPGEFVYQPVKLGARDGEIFLEAHHDVYGTRFDYWNETRTLVEEQGWSDLVDWGLVAAALDRKSGMPTRVSHGQALLEWRRPPVQAAEAPKARLRTARRQARAADAHPRRIAKD